MQRTKDAEARMIASIVNGDSQLYSELIRPYVKRVYAIALFFLRNIADAEDVTQETLLKAFRNLTSFRQEAQFSTWLLSIAANEARSSVRKRARARIESFDVCADGECPAMQVALGDSRNIPSDLFERKELRFLLCQAIHKLPGIYREVFLLREVEELDAKETAAALNISLPSVKVRLHRARMMLQERLAFRLQRIRKGAPFQGRRSYEMEQTDA